MLDRLAKKYKTESLTIDLNHNIDVTDVALQKYQDLKKDYNFISFEEANKKKSVATGSFEQYHMPIFDFNQNLYQFRKEGKCPNPNPDIKGYVYNSKGKEEV